jgi:hypothetical protein
MMVALDVTVVNVAVACAALGVRGRLPPPARRARTVSPAAEG